MLFDNNDYFNMIMYLDNNKTYNDIKISNDGFYKGNMFDNEYVPYKNMNYIKPKVKNEKEDLLLKIMCSSFAINDYNLYLDLNPDDKEILNKLKEEIKKEEYFTLEYERKYGPINLNSEYNSSFTWINNPWPWDRKDEYYV